MVLIYHDIYRRKCRILGRFRFSCTNFDGHLKGQKLQDSVCTQYRATLKFSERLKQNESRTKKT